MKKVFFILILVNILAILFVLPLVSQAALPPMPGSVPSPPHSPQAAAVIGGITITNPLQATSIQALINNIINFVFWLAIVIVPLIILWGAFTFMTAAGDPQKIDTGKKIIFWAIVGLAIILFGKGIISIIKSVLGG